MLQTLVSPSLPARGVKVPFYSPIFLCHMRGRKSTAVRARSNHSMTAVVHLKWRTWEEILIFNNVLCEMRCIRRGALVVIIV